MEAEEDTREFSESINSCDHLLISHSLKRTNARTVQLSSGSAWRNHQKQLRKERRGEVVGRRGELLGRRGELAVM